MNFKNRYKDVIQRDKLHVLSLSVLLDNLCHTRGGVAANIAYNLALLGDKPYLLTAAGKDAGDYLSDLHKLGINTSHIHLSHLPTATYTVLTDLDDNQIGGFYPGAMADSSSLTLTPWHGKQAIVVISAYDPATMRRLMTEAKEGGHTVIYDIGQQVTNVPAEDLTYCLSLADILFVNDYELGVLAKRTGQSENKIKSKVPNVITTLGGSGSRIEGAKVHNTISIPALTNIKIVDPTGAGDAYRSGFLHAFARGWDLTKCGRLGTVIASYAVESQGTQEHVFTLQDVSQRYKQQFKEDPWTTK